MDRAGICSAGNDDITLERDFTFHSKCFKEFYDIWMTNYGTVHNLHRGSVAQDRASLFGIIPGLSDCDIHSNAVVRINGVGSRLASAEPQFFLYSKDKVQVVGVRPDMAQSIQHGGTGNSIVQIGRD